jgi:hypothetical protein
MNGAIFVQQYQYWFDHVLAWRGGIDIVVSPACFEVKPARAEVVVA